MMIDLFLTVLEISALVSLIFVAVHLISYMHYRRQVLKTRTVVKDVLILQQFLKIKHDFK